MTKKEMRKQMLSLRDLLSEKERREKSKAVEKSLFDLEQFQKADIILSYQSFRSEVVTKEINEKIRESGKSLYLPKTYADRKEMIFYRVYSDEDLVPGYQGIMEPKEKNPLTKEVLASINPEKVWMLMPGAAFDGSRNRIGYGGGYYDRFLSQMRAYIGTTCIDEEETKNATPDQTKSFGIKKVFINGELVLDNDELNKSALKTTGRALTV